MPVDVSKRLNVSADFFTIGQPHHSSFSIPNVTAIFQCGPVNSVVSSADLIMSFIIRHSELITVHNDVQSWINTRTLNIAETSIGFNVH